MKKSLLLLVLMLLPMVASADAVEIDGIYYNLVSKAKAAEVTSNPKKYSGEVVIPEKVTYNGIECSVTSIGACAFVSCSGLTSISIPNSVTSIGEWAFSGCTGLTSVTIPNGVMSIGSYAFSDCSGLTSVTIPNSVTSIGESAFSDCSGLTSVHISDLAAWCKVSFDGGSANPLYYAKHLYMNGSEVKDLVIPNSVTSIGSGAFSGCSGLTSVIIPNSVTSIGQWAFSKCSGLTSVTIPNSVTSIGNYAFQYCSGLTSVTIPNSVISIGENAFSGCSGLKSVTIPNSVTSIGSYAFAKCSELTDVYSYAEKVPSTYSNAFKDSYIEYATLHVPAEAIELYKAATPWKNFKSIVSLSASSKYKIIYIVDGVTYKECEYYEGEAITPEPAPTKEGYTFSGWSWIPKKMPAEDVIITGTFTTISKCATPTISLKDGEIVLSCETEGVEYVPQVTPLSEPKCVDGKVQLAKVYRITIYATKEGYDDSDSATMDIDMSIGKKGDVNGDGKVTITDAVNVVNIILNGGADEKVNSAPAYYLIGGPGEWTPEGAMQMQFSHSDKSFEEDPVYTYTFAGTGSDMWFSFGDEMAINAIELGNWAQIYGTTGNSTDLSGSVKRRCDLAGDNSFCVDGKSKYYRFTINMLENTYEIVPFE